MSRPVEVKRRTDSTWYRTDTGARVGDQRPRIFVPAQRGVTDAMDDVLALCRVFGVDLDEWQRWAMEQAVQERLGGTWAAGSVGLVVPRQNGKTKLVIVRILCGVLLWGERLVTYSAHKFDTALETFGEIGAMLSRARPDHPDHSPEIQAWLQAVGWYRIINTNGHEAIALGNGSRIRVVARTRGKGRGFTGDTIIFDEAGFDIAQSIMDAMIPTLSARPNPQVWYLSSSGDTTSHVLLGVRASAMAGAKKSVCYMEWSVPQQFDTPGAPSPDVSDIGLAYISNPALGVRITESYLTDIEMPSLSRDGYLRERLGVWAEPDDTDDPVDKSAWAGATRGGKLRFTPSVLALDVSMARGTACLVAVGPSGGERLGVAVEAYGPALDVESRAVERSVELAVDGYPMPIVVPAYGPAAAAGGRLRAAGGTVIDMPSGKAPAACAGLADHVARLEIEHAGQEPLDHAVESARKKYSGSNWTLDRGRGNGPDVSPLWAAAAGVWHLDTMDAADDETIGDDDVGVGT